MKKIILIITFLLSSFSFAETINVKVKGMVCAFCATGLEKKFKKVEGIKSIDVSLKNKLITAVFNGKAPLNDEELKKIVVDSGYNVSSISRKE